MRALIVCVFFGLLIASLRLNDVFWNPHHTVMGEWLHPDNLGNHWLLVWVAEQLSNGEGILHNDQYYIPFGDTPWLAGNGSEGIWFLPFYILFGWPMGAGVMTSVLLVATTYAGRRLAMTMGVDQWTSIIAGVSISCSTYLFREMSCGRFTQTNIFFLLMALGSFSLLLKKNERRHIFSTAFWSAICAIGYWYHGLFFLLSVIPLIIIHTQNKKLWTRILFAGFASLLLISPILWLFVTYWSSIPGTSEVIFPSQESIHDSLTLSVPWSTRGGNSSVQAQPIPVLLLALIGMFTLHRGTKQQKKYGVLLLIWILFFLCLSLGPDGKLYLWVYGWLESTKRFWWPSRHIVMVDISWALLASLSAHVLFLKYSQKKRIFASLILSFLIPMSLWMQGNRPFYVPQKKILSDNIYTHLAKKPGEAILQLPLSPKIAFSQEVLIQQLYHKKKLLTGHALWVDRVRPAEWDDLVLKNPLLRSLQQYELGKTFTINAPASAFTELRALGIDWVVLDKSMFTKDFSTFFHKYVELWTSILGAPDMQSETIWIWSMDGWNGTISFDAPQWNRDSSLKLGNGRTSIQGKFPPSSLWMNED